MDLSLLASDDYKAVSVAYAEDFDSAFPINYSQKKDCEEFTVDFHKDCEEDKADNINAPIKPYKALTQYNIVKVMRRFCRLNCIRVRNFDIVFAEMMEKSNWRPSMSFPRPIAPEIIQEFEMGTIDKKSEVILSNKTLKQLHSRRALYDKKLEKITALLKATNEAIESFNQSFWLPRN